MYVDINAKDSSNPIYAIHEQGLDHTNVHIIIYSTYIYTFNAQTLFNRCSRFCTSTLVSDVHGPHHLHKCNCSVRDTHFTGDS